MSLKLQLKEKVRVLPNWRDTDAKLDIEAKPP